MRNRACSLALLVACAFTGGLRAEPGQAATTVTAGVQRPRREGHATPATWGRERQARTVLAVAGRPAVPPVWEWAADSLRCLLPADGRADSAD